MSRKTEAGQGGRKGHSNMAHWEHTEEIKDDRRGRARRTSQFDKLFSFGEARDQAAFEF